MPQLRDIAAVRSGLAPPRTLPQDATCAYLQIADLDPVRRRLLRAGPPTAGRATPVRAGDVLVPARGDRTAAVRPDDALLGAYAGLDIYLVRPDPRRLDPDYLAAFLVSDRAEQALRGAKAGTGLQRLPVEALARLDVPLPPLPRQRLIGGLAACLREQDSLLERRREVQGRFAAAQINHVLQLGSLS